jgi:hypothetical protein
LAAWLRALANKGGSFERRPFFVPAAAIIVLLEEAVGMIHWMMWAPGGHFLVFEEAELLVRELRASLRRLRRFSREVRFYWRLRNSMLLEYSKLVSVKMGKTMNAGRPETSDVFEPGVYVIEPLELAGSNVSNCKTRL